MTTEETPTNTNLEENDVEASNVETAVEEVQEEKEVNEVKETLTEEGLSERVINELNDTRTKYSELQDKHNALLEKIERMIFSGGAVISSDDRKSETDINNFSENTTVNPAQGYDKIPSLEDFKGKFF